MHASSSLLPLTADRICGCHGVHESGHEVLHLLAMRIPINVKLRDDQSAEIGALDEHAERLESLDERESGVMGNVGHGEIVEVDHINVEVHEQSRLRVLEACQDVARSHSTQHERGDAGCDDPDRSDVAQDERESADGSWPEPELVAERTGLEDPAAENCEAESTKRQEHVG